jgi:hypothetical protein
MHSEEDLASALSAGALSEEAAVALRVHVDKRCMALPSIALLLAFTGGVFFACFFLLRPSSVLVVS